jgi:DNA polymerase-4
MIALVDMNCFFASIEQLDNPQWRYRPVAVTNGKLGSTIITASYEARAYGVKTGMRLREARELCPQLIQAASRPQRYAELSTRIMASLRNVTPDIEVYSVDEAFLDLTHCQQLYFDPLEIGQKIKHHIAEAAQGLRCSVGISGDKTTAKFAAKKHKPDGLTVIHPDDAEAALAPYHVTELSGINKGVAGFLKQYGVEYCGQMKQLPIGILAKRYGNVGRRIWMMAQGRDPDPIHPEPAPPKTIGHGKVLPPQTRDKTVVLTYFRHMSEKVAARLRRHGFQSTLFFVGLKTEQGWLKSQAKLPFHTDDGKVIYQICYQFMETHWQGQGVWQVQVTALAPEQGIQHDLFMPSQPQQREQMNQTMDNINQRFGEFTLAPASILNRSEMPNVIAPAWKPSGHRKTI